MPSKAARRYGRDRLALLGLVALVLMFTEPRAVVFGAGVAPVRPLPLNVWASLENDNGQSFVRG